MTHGRLKARHPLQIFAAVIKALFMRELGMRISVSKSGIFWTFFEPFMSVFMMVLIKVAIFGRSAENFDFAAFLALNFTAFYLFKNIFSQSLGAFTANKGLFVYKQVKPIDTIVARAMVEMFISGMVIVIFVTIGAYFGYDLSVKNFPVVALGFLWIAIFGISLGLLFAVGNTFFPSIGKVANIVMYFILFGSAVFYTISMLPPNLGEMLLYNPLTHFMEMIHGYYFYVLDDRYVDYEYMTLWTLTSLFLGLILYRKFEKRIISQ